MIWGQMGRVAIALLAVAIGAAPLAGDAPSAVTGALLDYSVKAGDTLYAVAARSGVDVATIAADNELRVDAPLSVGQRLRLGARHIVPQGVAGDTLVVNVPQRHAFVWDGEAIRALPVAVGRRSWPTPAGVMTIVDKEANPTWDVPASIREEARRAGKELPDRVPPGPANPLGAFWLRLSGGGVGLHGTNAPSSIYKAVTHGCVRLHPDDISWLFPRVAVGTKVLVVYQPILLAEAGGEIWLEVHPDVYGRGRDPRAEVQRLADMAGLTSGLDWQAVGAVLAAQHGVARAVGRQ
jgi:L,D-transpeptidase ErfK/SrfK